MTKSIRNNARKAGKDSAGTIIDPKDAPRTPPMQSGWVQDLQQQREWFTIAVQHA